MASPVSKFPLSGVIGIIDSSADQLEKAKSAGLRCVEIRADLLRTANLADKDLLSLVESVKKAELACLFTLRHESQGGTFGGNEDERVLLCQQAIAAGADIVDLEYGTQASSMMLEMGKPILLSHHNFNAMLSADELQSLTDSMEQLKPAAIKIIPTGSSLDDAATMLSWVSKAKENIKRIGFSMGEAGGVSRILTLAHGAPVTYASFGAPVAPGQIDIALMLERYRCNQMSTDTAIAVIIGDSDQVATYVNQHSERLNQDSNESVLLAFSKQDQATVERLKNSLGIRDIVVL